MSGGAACDHVRAGRRRHRDDREQVVGSDHPQRGDVPTAACLPGERDRSRRTPGQWRVRAGGGCGTGFGRTGFGRTGATALWLGHGPVGRPDRRRAAARLRRQGDGGVQAADRGPDGAAESPAAECRRPLRGAPHLAARHAAHPVRPCARNHGAGLDRARLADRWASAAPGADDELSGPRDLRAQPARAPGARRTRRRAQGAGRHVRRAARPAGGGVRVPAPVRRECLARAADADHARARAGRGRAQRPEPVGRVAARDVPARAHRERAAGAPDRGAAHARSEPAWARVAHAGGPARGHRRGRARGAAGWN